MADLVETATYEAGIRQFELTDAATGGEDGLMNSAIRQLANRTGYLKALLDLLVAGNVIPNGALPAAGVGYRGIPWIVFGDAGVPDRTYVCQKLHDDTYAWVRMGRLALPAAPTVGTWTVLGEVIENSSGTPNAPAGWVLTVAGTPGTWNELAPVNP